MSSVDASKLTFLQRNEFLIRRLHSLTGLVPVGAYMVVHLLTNASIWNGPGTFQLAVYGIHLPGKLLPLIEWGLVMGPLLFHAVIGVVITQGALPNHSNYPYTNNIRYSLQRASGMVAFVWIAWHIFHMHGLLHSDWWLENVARPFGGAQFAPFNAGSSAAEAMQSSGLGSFFYLIGLMACVFHLANGVWTMGITWGLWVTPAAQARANVASIVIGVGLSVIALAAWSGFTFMSEEQIEHARQVEDRMLERRVATGELSAEEAEHKRAHREAGDEPDNSDTDSNEPNSQPASADIQ